MGGTLVVDGIEVLSQQGALLETILLADLMSTIEGKPSPHIAALGFVSA
jgi:hypothetical protein